MALSRLYGRKSDEWKKFKKINGKSKNCMEGKSVLTGEDSIQVLKRWIQDNRKIFVWGGVNNRILSKVCCRVSDFIPQGFLDNYLSEKSIVFRNVTLPVFRPEEVNLHDSCIVFCIGNRNNLIEIITALSKENIKLENVLDGCAIAELPGSEEDPYEVIAPSATYAPWRKDKEFLCVYNAICKNTLVDMYRCYNLWRLVEQSGKCNKGAFIEIGVWRGGTGSLISKMAEKVAPLENTYLCDTFAGVVKTGVIDVYYKDGAHSDTSREVVETLLKFMKILNVQIRQGIFPNDFEDEFWNMSFRFAHIDVDIYQSGKDVFEYLWSRMESGGIVVFDDYGFKTTVGISRLVDELSLKVLDGIISYNLTGQAVCIKI